MRLALVQARLDRKSASRNMRLLATQIDRAANVDHTVDLIVLPADCDTGGATTRGYVAAIRASARELIAAKAREWGLMIAAGVHDGPIDAQERSAVLFDVDGDAVAASTPSSPIAWHTDEAVGQIGLCMRRKSSDQAPEPPINGLLLALPTAGRRSDERWVADLAQNEAARSAAAIWAVVASAGATCPQDAPASTFVISEAGKLLGAAESTGEEILHVEIE